MTRTISTGELHLAVHQLLGSHRESVGQAVREKARAQLLVTLKDAQALVAAAAARCPGKVDRRTGQVRHSNEHARALADHARILATLHRIDRPMRVGPGLLHQLALIQTLNVTDPYTAPTGKPSSRPPSGTPLDSIDLLRRVDAITSALLQQLAAELPHPVVLKASWQQRLWQVPTLTEQLPNATTHDLTREVDRHLTSWINAARVLLRHVAPMVTITTPCPHCQQQSLIVREDATSDVVCFTEDCVDEHGQQSRWGREHWKALLEGRYASGLVNTEAAALHLGVEAATIRDWKRRGLITPATSPEGVPLGTSRQPFWLLSDVIEAATAAKPRRSA